MYVDKGEGMYVDRGEGMYVDRGEGIRERGEWGWPGELRLCVISLCVICRRGMGWYDRESICEHCGGKLKKTGQKKARAT